MKKIDSDKLVGIILRISLCLALVLVITACANIKADPRTAGTNTSISKEQESDVDGEQTTKGNNSIANVKSMADVSTDYLREVLVKSKREQSGSCSESCEVFGGQMDMFEEQAND